jgi:hypothetical protein
LSGKRGALGGRREFDDVMKTLDERRAGRDPVMDWILFGGG